MSVDGSIFDFFLILVGLLGLCTFVGFMMGVWYFNCAYVFPIFGKLGLGRIAKGTIHGAVRATISLTEKLKPLASFWLIGISLAVIFVVVGIVYGSNVLGSSTASATAKYCTAPVPETLPKQQTPPPTKKSD